MMGLFTVLLKIQEQVQFKSMLYMLIIFNFSLVISIFSILIPIVR